MDAGSMVRAAALSAIWIAGAAAQHPDHIHDQTPVPEKESPSHDHSSMGHGLRANLTDRYLMSLASGTSLNPRSWPMPMYMRSAGAWNFMAMGQAFLIHTQQSGPRGGDKTYSANWGMLSAQRSLGAGSLMFQSMISLDPATITRRGYPLLLQTGETAFGSPLVDAQHPHDFIMGLGVHYAHPLGKNTLIHGYYAPVGDPALGPVAFPHRASALELPQATLAHHLQDSTHIANNVATVALQHRWVRLEASGFHGTEPDEGRWDIDWGPMNSYSGRVSIFPTDNWMAQFSAGRLANPERHLTHGPHGEAEDVARMTASIHYTRPTGAGNAWSTSLIWGRNRTLGSGRKVNSYLVETLYPATRKDFLTARAELVDKDELFANDHDLEHELARTAGSVFRVQGYTVGYTRDLKVFRNLQTGLGGNVTAYVIPDALKPYYGSRPWGVNVFLRFRLKSPQ
jgi:hypothetical protein